MDGQPDAYQSTGHSQRPSAGGAFQEPRGQFVSPRPWPTERTSDRGMVRSHPQPIFYRPVVLSHLLEKRSQRDDPSDAQHQQAQRGIRQREDGTYWPIGVQKSE